MGRSRPSYSQGYARYGATSERPDLRKILVGAWMPSFGPTGGTLRDVSRYGAHGTLTNMTSDADLIISTAPRVPGHALDFGGDADAHVVIPAGGQQYNFGSGDFSVEAWVYSRETDSFSDVVQKRNTAASTLWKLQQVTTTRMDFELALSGGTDARAQFTSWTNNAWHHVIGVRRSGTIYVYVDTVPGTTAATSDDIDDTADVFTISNSGADNCDATIPLIRLYRAGLKVSEIHDLFVDPMAMFRRRERAAFAPVSDLSISPPLGAALIGSDPSLLGFGVLMPLDDRA